MDSFLEEMKKSVAVSHATGSRLPCRLTLYVLSRRDQAARDERFRRSGMTASSAAVHAGMSRKDPLSSLEHPF